MSQQKLIDINIRMWLFLLCVWLVLPSFLGSGYVAAEEPGPPLAGTKPLTMTGDIASEMIAGVDRFLLRQIDGSAANREKHWRRDFTSLKAYEHSIEPNRKRLAHIARGARCRGTGRGYRAIRRR